MAGAFPSRPNQRVTNLTSLTNFRARPREQPPSPRGGPDPGPPDSPSWEPLATEKDAPTPSATSHPTPHPAATEAEVSAITGSRHSFGGEGASPVRPFMGGQAKELREEVGIGGPGGAAADQPPKPSGDELPGGGGVTAAGPPFEAVEPVGCSLPAAGAQSLERESERLGEAAPGEEAPREDGHTNGVSGGQEVGEDTTEGLGAGDESKLSMREFVGAAFQVPVEGKGTEANGDASRR